MAALIVIICIIIFLFLLLLFPVTVCASFEDALTAKVGYLFFVYKIFPHPEGPEKKEKNDIEQKKEKQKKNDIKSKIKGIIEQKGLMGFLNIIKEFVAIGTGTAKTIFSHIVINNISVNITVADEDAAQTAIYYGYTSSVVYPAMALLVNNMKCKKYDMNIAPDFNVKKSRVQFEIKAYIQLLFILSTAIPAFIKSIKVIKTAKTPPKNKNTTE